MNAHGWAIASLIVVGYGVLWRISQLIIWILNRPRRP